MDMQYEMLGNKQKQVFTKRGRRYTRKGYDLTVEDADRFRRKCQMLNVAETYIVAQLVVNFCHATGWGQEYKKAPAFETCANQHVRDAVHIVGRNIAPYEP